MESADHDEHREGAAELEELSRDECLALLAGHSVGRIAVVGADGLPFVVPVNYELAGETVVFRTGTGTKFDALNRHPVAFEIDMIDPLHHIGWTVLVQGVAHEASPHELGPVNVEPWLGPRHHWIQVVPRYINGRRIRLPDTDDDARGYV
jgi:hypothetical protein